MSPAAVRTVRPYFDDLVRVLQETTAEALSTESFKLTADHIEVFGLTWAMASANAPAIQILGIASASEERLPKLDSWTEALKKAVGEFFTEAPVQLFPPRVEVWPIMPPGK